MIEEWKDIKGYEGLYQVSNIGRVKSLNRVVNKNDGKLYPVKEQILKRSIDIKGYIRATLCGVNIPKNCQVHRLVALEFIHNPKNKPQVNHINGIKTDNRIENLEWCTAQENIQHAIDHKLRNHKVKVLMLTKNNIKLFWFDSMKSAENITGIYYTHISQCCSKQRKSAGGYKWEYYYETE